MSAWLVQDKTINHIADLLVYGLPQKHAIRGWDNQKNCAVKLKTINLESLKQRYGDEYDEYDVHISHERYPVSLAISLIQSLKHVQCFKYQCSEGDVPDTMSYKEIEKLEDQLSWEIICNLKEYNESKWE